MIHWRSPYRIISSREQLEAYKRLPSTHRAPTISITSAILDRSDRATLSCPNLKGLWINGQLTAARNDATDLFDALLHSQTLELLAFHLNGTHEVLNYHKLTLKSPIANTLRLLHISAQYLREREISLLGRTLRFNSVIEEFSVLPEPNIVHKKYSRLFMYFALSNLRIVYSIPMDVMSFFCAAAMLSQSKVVSFWMGNANLLEPTRWWRYLLGSICKLQRKVSIKNPSHMNLFFDDERNLLDSLMKREGN